MPSFNDFAPAPMPDMGRRPQKSANDRQDWVFMTPAEIMGVASEQLSRTQKRDENGQPDNLTPDGTLSGKAKPLGAVEEQFARQSVSVAELLGSGRWSNER